MSVEDTEVAASGPSAFEIGFGDVHDDGYSILVVVLDESVIGIDCVSFDCSIAALDKFDRLDLGNAASLLLLILIHF